MRCLFGSAKTPGSYTPPVTISIYHPVPLSSRDPLWLPRTAQSFGFYEVSTSWSEHESQVLRAADSAPSIFCYRSRAWRDRRPIQSYIRTLNHTFLPNPPSSPFRSFIHLRKAESGVVYSAARSHISRILPCHVTHLKGFLCISNSLSKLSCLPFLSE